jgi:hypothetical protein
MAAMLERSSQTLIETALGYYQQAGLWRSRWETMDALSRARAAFSQAGRAAAAQFCEDLRRQVESGGTDELPPLPPALLTG